MENTPLKRADPEEEAAFFNDDGEAVEKDEGSSEKPADEGKGASGDGAPCEYEQVRGRFAAIRI